MKLIYLFLCREDIKLIGEDSWPENSRVKDQKEEVSGKQNKTKQREKLCQLIFCNFPSICLFISNIIVFHPRSVAYCFYLGLFIY